MAGQGRRIHLTLPNGTSPGPEWFTIVGIAPDIRQSSTEDASGRDGVVYLSYGTNPLPSASIVARSDADPSVVATVLRERVRAVDPDLPLFEVMTLDDLLAASDERVGLRVFGTMVAVFAVVAVLLATVGLYAVTAYAAAQRTREIGVRVARVSFPHVARCVSIQPPCCATNRSSVLACSLACHRCGCESR